MINQKKVLCLIPARSGSKGLKNKNLKKVGKKTLVRHVIDASLKSKYITDIAVSSNSDLILDECIEGIFKIKRPNNISTDDATSLSALLHSRKYFESVHNKKYDYFIIVQVTNPLVWSEDIDGVLELLIERNFDSCISVVETKSMHFSRLFEIVNGVLKQSSGSSIEFLQRQKLSPTYTSNGSCFATCSNVIDDGLLIGKQCGAHIVSRERYIDIDNQFDLDLANFMFNRLKNEK